MTLSQRAKWNKALPDYRRAEVLETLQSQLDDTLRLAVDLRIHPAKPDAHALRALQDAIRDTIRAFGGEPRRNEGAKTPPRVPD